MAKMRETSQIKDSASALFIFSVFSSDSCTWERSVEAGRAAVLSLALFPQHLFEVFMQTLALQCICDATVLGCLTLGAR